MKSNLDTEISSVDAARQFVGSEYVPRYSLVFKKILLQSLGWANRGTRGCSVNSGKVTAMASSDGTHRLLMKQRLSGFSAGHRVACGLSPRDMYSIW